MFDPTKPYCRRDGKPAKIVYTFKKGHHFVVLDDSDGWVIVFADGRYSTNGTYSEYDLINIPETLDRTRPVQTRDGREVRNICWDYLLPRGEVGIAGVVNLKNESRDYCEVWAADGRVYPSSPVSTTKLASDLINVPVSIPTEKIERWQNIYKRNGFEYNTGKLYATFEEATNRADMYTVACIKVSFTEGEGLS